MIWDSWPWKLELARRTMALERRTHQRRWSERSFAALEFDVFVMAYAMRKLAEAHKVSDEVLSSSLQVQIHASTGRSVDLMNWHKLDELYDMDLPSSGRLSVVEFCNQLIHSFVFVPVMNDHRGLSGLFFSSDRDKGSRLYYAGVEAVVGLASHVVEDDIVSVRMVRDSIGAPLRVVQKSSEGHVR